LVLGDNVVSSRSFSQNQENEPGRYHVSP